jgi:hypothetical protein
MFVYHGQQLCTFQNNIEGWRHLKLPPLERNPLDGPPWATAGAKESWTEPKMYDELPCPRRKTNRKITEGNNVRAQCSTLLPNSPRFRSATGSNTRKGREEDKREKFRGGAQKGTRREQEVDESVENAE